MEGLTIEELRGFLTEQYKAYVLDPQVYVRPMAYRPIRIYVGGEVKRPGYYTLSGNRELQNRELQRGTDKQRPGLGQVQANTLSTHLQRPQHRIPHRLRRHSTAGHYSLHGSVPSSSHTQTGQGPGWWPHPHQPQLPFADH